MASDTAACLTEAAGLPAPGELIRCRMLKSAPAFADPWIAASGTTAFLAEAAGLPVPDELMGAEF